MNMMSSLESYKTSKLNFVITYSAERLQRMKLYGESNCKFTYNYVKRIIEKYDGQIIDVTSSTINSKSIGGTHLVLEASFTDPINPQKLQQYCDDNIDKSLAKITIAL